MAHASGIDRSTAAVECIKKEVDTLAGISCHHSISKETRLQVVNGKRVIVNAHLDDIAKAIRGDAGPETPPMPDSMLPAKVESEYKVMVYFDLASIANSGWLTEKIPTNVDKIPVFEKLIQRAGHFDNEDLAYQAACERRTLIAKALGKTVEDIADQYQFFFVRVKV